MKTFIYKLLALLAFSAALALGLVVLHFTLATAEITVKAKQVPVNINDEIILQIANEDLVQLKVETPKEAVVQKPKTKEEEIAKLRELILNNVETSTTTTPVIEPEKSTIKTQGKSLKIQLTETLTPQGEGTPTEGLAEGVVTIYNELSYSQPLVANTRLLTSNGILFRTKNRVIVPAAKGQAKGSIEMPVIADSKFKGAQGNIGPSYFTIPGLNSAKQKSIYAQSFTPFTGGLKLNKVIQPDDITKAQESLTEKLKEKALEEFIANGLPVNSTNIYLEPTIFTNSAKVGEKKDQFDITGSASATALIFNKNELLAETKKKLNQSISADQILLAYNNDSFSYEIKFIDEIQSTATVKTYLEGFAVLKNGNSLIDPKELAGLSAEEIQTRLLKNTAVTEVNIKFSPFWVSRAPRIMDKIKIVVKQQ
jgi:hypothetical protein